MTHAVIITEHDDVLDAEPTETLGRAVIYGTKEEAEEEATYFRGILPSRFSVEVMPREKTGMPS